MSYKLQQPSFDISENFSTLLKFYGINIVTSIVIACLIVLVITTMGVGLLGHIAIVLVILVTQVYAITTFEHYDGCYKKT